MTLRQVFEQHRGRFIGKIDHFFDDYETHFARYRNTPVRLLEIGIDKGGSLELWRSYFGPDAEIHGIDINPAAAAHAPPDAVIHIGSQDDKPFMSQVLSQGRPFDIVIDDASHLMAHQIETFNTVYPAISDNGLYICEDSFTSYWKEYGGQLGGKDTFLEYTKGLIDELHAYWASDADFEPTEFTAITQSICIYSGAVVFQRKRVDRPVYITRNNDALGKIAIEQLKIAAGRNNKS